MPLAAGTRLGPYEILAPLGAGGMGEVYRVRDPRLGRDVAIKILPVRFSNDTDRLRRFEHEVRAVGVLNHPNILAVYDTGIHDGSPYVVSELLEGQTLRGRIGDGPLPARKAIDIAVQVARGLAAAHEKSIVHRDLKPENLFLTKDGRAKILDFGLAKLAQPTSDEVEAETRTRETDPGTVVGTVGYMSPEQVRGEAVDPRSDIFAFGTILYEMLSGRRAFKRETTAETLTAILKEDPPELESLARDVPPALARIVQHCLEKERDERFQAARDLAFDLQSLSVSDSSVRTALEPRRRRRAGVVAWLGLSTLTAALGYFLATASHRSALPVFQPLTFRRGHVTTARFMPDGQTIVYGAMWEGAPIRMFSVRLGAAESSPLSLPAGDVLSVSNSGELAVSLDRRFTWIFSRSGRLARAPLSGAAPRVLLEDVHEAAWTPDGQRLLITRRVEGKCRLELGIGNILYETAGWISDARLSPNGDLVAFVDHPLVGWDYGSVAVVPATHKGQKRTLTRGSPCTLGLAWHPQGREVWYTASGGWHQTLFAVTLDGRVRPVLSIPGRLLLHDIDKQGRLLVTSEYANIGTAYGRVETTEERDLSWLEASMGTSVSADGEKVVISEPAEGGRFGSVYLRSADGSPAIRLGSGLGGALSPDGRLVAAMADEPPRILFIPTGAGEARALATQAKPMFAMAWLPDGKRIVFPGVEERGGMRLYSLDISGGVPKPFTPEGFGDEFSVAVSHDGEWAATMGPGRRLYLCPLGGGEPVPLTEVEAEDRPMRFSNDGHWLYLSRSGDLSARIIRVDLRQHRREIWKDIHPRELEGMVWIQPTAITPDGSRYVYWYMRIRSTLFLVEGVR